MGVCLFRSIHPDWKRQCRHIPLRQKFSYSLQANGACQSARSTCLCGGARSLSATHTTFAGELMLIFNQRGQLHITFSITMWQGCEKWCSEKCSPFLFPYRFCPNGGLNSKFFSKFLASSICLSNSAVRITSIREAENHKKRVAQVFHSSQSGEWLLLL